MSMDNVVMGVKVKVRANVHFQLLRTGLGFPTITTPINKPRIIYKTSQTMSPYLLGNYFLRRLLADSYLVLNEYISVVQLVCYDCVYLGLFSSLISRQVSLDACI